MFVRFPFLCKFLLLQVKIIFIIVFIFTWCWQVCSNGTRVFVEKSILDDFLTKLVERTKKIRVGDPMNPDTQMGALISEEHLHKVLEYVRIGREQVCDLWQNYYW